ILCVRYIARVLVDNDQQFKLRGVMVDVTRSREAEAALRASEEKYREIVENINDIVHATDEKGAVTYVSPSIQRNTGYSEDEIVGRFFTDFIHPEDLPRVMESFHKTLSGGIEPLEYRILAKSGEVRWVRTHSGAIHAGERV